MSPIRQVESINLSVSAILNRYRTQRDKKHFQVGSDWYIILFLSYKGYVEASLVHGGMIWAATVMYVSRDVPSTERL